MLPIDNSEIVELVKKTALYARSLKKICHALNEELSFKISRSTLRRFFKRLSYTWKRFQKSLKSKQNKEQYQKKLSELKQLIQLHKDKFIDLVFADESSFSLEGYVPYGWQPKNKYIQITPSKTGTKNIFGIMSLDNRWDVYSCKGSMNSAAVIAFIGHFAKKIKQPTVLFTDNAPIHYSSEFEQKNEEWKNWTCIFFIYLLILLT